MSTSNSLFPDAKIGPERADVIATSSVIDATLETSTASSPGPSTSTLSSPHDHDQPMTLEEEDAHLVTDKLLTFRFVWSGKTLEFEISESDCVEDLKSTLQRLTNVPMERQKILGLTKGRMPTDGTKLSDLQPTVGKKFTLIGTPAGAELKDPDELPDLPDVLNDLEPDLDPAAQRAMVQDHRNIRKVREMTKKLQLNIMNPPRPGKRLLVLDIDYTILDTKPMTSGSLPAGQCARPGLHEFLTAAYEHYDIAIWSQTSWNWLEVKLVELGMIGGDQPYKISFVLDKTIMFQVYSMREGKEFKHAVKALKIIWNLIPQYNATNTIHIDDLSRNFVLNPRNGIKISAYKDCTSAKARQDEELYLCNVYLRFLAGVPDFQQVDHQKWRSVATSLKSLARRL